MKKFKTKKKNKRYKIILFIIIVFFSYFLISKYLVNSSKFDPKRYINSLLNNGFNNQLKNQENKNNNINPISLFEYNLSLKPNDKELEQQTIRYVEKVNSSTKNPLVYIYNTHESEEYKIDYKYEYSIIPNVKLSSYMLQEKLEQLGIESIVETSSIKEILDQNNWIYKNSYKASRILLEKRKEEYNTLNYYIDIHRDSSNYEKTTIKYDNKTYARVLFVVGLEHDNYQENLDLVSKLNNMIEEKVKGISRGISKKEGLGVNGVYNQDFHNNCILIEVGGVDNNIVEVSNTINILGDIIASYIKE